MLTKPEPIAVVAPLSLAGLVAAEGTAANAHASGLCVARAATRDLCDAIHGICLLHGHHPGLIDHVAGAGDVPAWLAAAAHRFGAERAWLARLVAAAGPLPSTPGQAEAQGAMAAQRHAFDTLARSDRAGCAIGAAAALLLDWTAIHRVLAVAADRFGIERQPFEAPHPAIAESHRRAALFAAQQVLAQHRGLWQLLESRAAARGN